MRVGESDGFRQDRGGRDQSIRNFDGDHGHRNRCFGLGSIRLALSLVLPLTQSGPRRLRQGRITRLVAVALEIQSQGDINVDLDALRSTRDHNNSSACGNRRGPDGRWLSGRLVGGQVSVDGEEICARHIATEAQRGRVAGLSEPAAEFGWVSGTGAVAGTLCGRGTGVGIEVTSTVAISKQSISY